MNDILLIIILTLAIAIGFFLGKRYSPKKNNQFHKVFDDPKYFQGLNYLLNEQPDKAVDAFVESLEVNQITLETHLALGNLMRKQGQVDRAIRIHQNLLARPLLDLTHQHQVHLELGKDFMAAGLLDRAEMLLKEVIKESPSLRNTAQRYLLDIYQDERDWEKAIEIGESLLGGKFFKDSIQKKHSMNQMIAHFYCELAEESLNKNKKSAAKKFLLNAQSIDKLSIRASLLIANLNNEESNYKQSIKILNKTIKDNPAFIIETLPILCKAYDGLYGHQGFDKFLKITESQISREPSIEAVLFLIDQLLVRSKEKLSYNKKAQELLSDYTLKCSSLEGFNKLLSIRLPTLSGEFAKECNDMHLYLQKLINKKLNYRCSRCGFSGRILHWRCPSCKTWDQMKSIRTDSFN